MPAVRYRDAPAAIDWLCTALGFRKHRIVADDGQLLHAHLTLGNAMIAVLPIRDTELDRLMKQPDEVGGAETQTCYLFVPDADEHYRAAKDAGAEILLDLDDDGHGGRGYVCRDLEGHIWNFGTYDPWGEDRPPRVRFSVSGIGSRPLVAIVILGVATAAAAGGWLFHGSEDARLNLELSAAHRSIEEAAAHATALERTDKGLAERAVREVPGAARS